MTLTDREIAILHLAIGEVEDPTLAELEKWREAYGYAFDDSRTSDLINEALALVPLYRHAFGIEAPCDTGINNSFCSCGVCMTRAQREAAEAPGEAIQIDHSPITDAEIKRTRELAELLGWNDRKRPSPASLAIANALSRTR